MRRRVLPPAEGDVAPAELRTADPRRFVDVADLDPSLEPDEAWAGAAVKARRRLLAARDEWAVAHGFGSWLQVPKHMRAADAAVVVDGAPA